MAANIKSNSCDIISAVCLLMFPYSDIFQAAESKLC